MVDFCLKITFSSIRDIEKFYLVKPTHYTIIQTMAIPILATFQTDVCRGPIIAMLHRQASALLANKRRLFPDVVYGFHIQRLERSRGI